MSGFDDFGNNASCPVCKMSVGDHEHYLLITEYVQGMKKGKFRIHFNCWKDQYNKATSQWFDLMGQVGQTLFNGMYELVQNNDITEDNIRQVLKEAQKVKGELMDIKPDNYIKDKDNKKGEKQQHGKR